MASSTYYTQGYPYDLNASLAWNKYYMYATSGSITGNRSRFLPLVNTNMDITQGQSGSPVYSYRTGYGYCAEAIVVAESGSTNVLILINGWLQNYFNKL